MYVSLCSVLPPENWSAYLPNKGNSLLYLLTKFLENANPLKCLPHFSWVVNILQCCSHSKDAILYHYCFKFWKELLKSIKDFRSVELAQISVCLHQQNPQTIYLFIYLDLTTFFYSL